MNYISENIKYLRAKRNLSQNQLATQLCLSRNQINSYENGNIQPSIETLQKIALYFEIKIDTLINIKIDKFLLQSLCEGNS